MKKSEDYHPPLSLCSSSSDNPLVTITREEKGGMTIIISPEILKQSAQKTREKAATVVNPETPKKVTPPQAKEKPVGKVMIGLPGSGRCPNDQPPKKSRQKTQPGLGDGCTDSSNKRRSSETRLKKQFKKKTYPGIPEQKVFTNEEIHATRTPSVIPKK